MTFDTSILSTPLKDREGVKRYGFPRVETLDPYISYDQDYFRPWVHENIIDMDDPKISDFDKNNIEFVVDVTDSGQSKLEMKLKPNLGKAQNQRDLRKRIIEQDIMNGVHRSRLDKDVLVLYIDNLSRAHFYRKMPKTAEWLENFYNNKDSDFNTYQYFRYHSVYYNTEYSNGALYYGEIEDVENLDNNLFDSYSENGYMTGFFKDSCETQSASIHDDDLSKLNQWDHFGGTVTCDGNYDTTDFKSLSPFTGKMSALHHCLYGMNMHQIQLDYTKQFWQAYPNNRKFFRTHFSEAHELSGELVGYMDEDFRDFLQWFYEHGYLEHTFLTIMSDHGAHSLTLRLPMFPDDSRYIENYYPILFHVTKNDIPDNYAHYLSANEQSFISSHDVYSSLKSIARNEESTSDEAASYPYAMAPMLNNHDCGDSTVYLKDCW